MESRGINDPKKIFCEAKLEWCTWLVRNVVTINREKVFNEKKIIYSQNVAPENIIAVCPECMKKANYSQFNFDIRKILMRKVNDILKICWVEVLPLINIWDESA